MLEPTVSSDGGAREGAGAADPARRAGDGALAIVEALPPLALMALVAALFELALARVSWHGLSDLVEPETLRGLRRLARFPRTLAAVSGTISLIVALMSFLRLPGWAPIGRRLAVAAFSGIFVPAIVVATVLPAASLRRKLVVFALAAANVLVTLLGMTAARYRPGAGARIATFTATATAFLALVVVGLGQLAHAEGPGVLGGIGALFAAHATGTQKVLMGLRHAGELCWLATPMAAAGTIAARGPDATLRARLATLAVLAALCAGAVVGFEQLIGHRFRLVLFGAFRLGLFTDDAPALYALPLGLGAAAGLMALARPLPALRQLGAAILLWLAAGFAPHTPIQLSYLVLAAMLLARAVQGLDPDGGWRRHQPWARFTRRVPPPAR